MVKLLNLTHTTDRPKQKSSNGDRGTHAVTSDWEAIMTLTQSGSVLSDELLERCAQRAAGYDRENRFFLEDFEELREAKYLLAAVPKEFGGLGLTLAEICREQRRLARRSAPTALGINMHFLATGIAADLWRKGDESQA
jgi:alkylation response protein AidB-like acyl-CoA dehydrogenase